MSDNEPCFYCDTDATDPSIKCPKCLAQEHAEYVERSYRDDMFLIDLYKHASRAFGLARIKITAELWIAYRDMKTAQHRLARLQELNAPAVIIRDCQRVVDAHEDSYLVAYLIAVKKRSEKYNKKGVS